MPKLWKNMQPPLSALKMEAVCSSEMLINNQNAMHCNNPEDFTRIHITEVLADPILHPTPFTYQHPNNSHFNLKMEAVCYSKILVYNQKTIQHKNLEDHTLKKYIWLQ
jgi:hypothetical protein